MKVKKELTALELIENGNDTSSLVIDSTSQHHFLNTLNQNDSPYINLLHQLPAAIYTCNAKGEVAFYNKAAAVLWGREPEIGKDLWCGSWKIYNMDNSPMLLENCPMAIALKERRPVNGHEIIVERPDGKRVNVLPHPRPLFDASGNLTGAVNMLIDITELKEATLTVKESEERFHIMAEQAPIIIWMTDTEGNFSYVNKKWSEFTGNHLSDVTGSRWMEFIHPEDKPTVASEWNNAVASTRKYDSTFRYKNASQTYSIVQHTGNPRYNATGQFVGYIGIMQDITLQENTKSSLKVEIESQTKNLLSRTEELRKSEERYHRMIAEVQDYAIILLSKDGIIENWNKGAEEIKGYQASEVIGKSFSIFYTEEDQKNRLPETLIEKARVEGKSNHEGWRVKKDGTKFWGSITITALHDDDNNVIGFSKVTRNLTQRRNAELQLQEKNRTLEAMNQELASFAYVSSHDLQEPLRKIQTFASRIIETENENLSPKGKDYFLRMQNAALRMETLIEDLLTYSRTNTSEKNFEFTNLNTLLEEIRSELWESIEDKNAVIKSSPLPTLEVIPFQIRQLLLNILGNALKFSKPDVTPAVQISANIVKGSKLKNTFPAAEKNYHHISITDNGIGFEPEHSTRIFEVFQRLHGRSEYSGTGIGLAICKKIMDNHGGFITAESELDQGATFHLYFPA